MITHRTSDYRKGLFGINWKWVHLAFNDGTFSQSKDILCGPFMEWRIKRWERQCIKSLRSYEANASKTKEVIL